MRTKLDHVIFVTVLVFIVVIRVDNSEIISPAPCIDLDVVAHFLIEGEVPCLAVCLAAVSFLIYELKSEKSSRPFSVEESQFT